MKKLSDFIQDIVFQDSSPCVILQGGNAFKDVQPIKKEHIGPVIEELTDSFLTPVFHITRDCKALFTLGSTGKKPQSGDIDLCINVNMLPAQKPLKAHLKALYSYIKMNSNINVIVNPIQDQMLQVEFPVKSTGQKVQTDILFTEFPVFTKWYMRSPLPSQSRYKAAHRNQLIRAIPRTMTKQILQQQAGQAVQWFQQDISHDGVSEDIQTLLDKQGNRLMYKDSQLLLPEYAELKSRTWITHSPKKCCEMYLGDINPDEFISFQRLLEFMKSDEFIFAEMRDDILYTAAEMLKSNSKLEFPEQLQLYLPK